MKRYLPLVVMLVLGIILGAVGYALIRTPESFPQLSPITQIKTKPLERYAIDVLQKRVFTPTPLVLDEPTATTAAYTRWNFHYTVDGLKVTGVAHIPVSASTDNKKPVIVQYRGFVAQENYEPGVGTEHSAEVYARNGFITLAPDFLGYGGSDMPSMDVFEERFQTYTTALQLLSSLETLPMADTTKVGIWGHSNGGQIAITVLEVVVKTYPATLWAPVTKPFPYSILYYTDDAEDKGKLLRRVLAKFEQDYDVDLYSLTNYIDRLHGPMLLHQGTGDEAVPSIWSDAFAQKVKKAEKELTYYVYPGATHDMVGAWSTVVARDIAFFEKYLK